MTFRFIHTADWQLGKPFGQFPADAAHELRAQRLRTVGVIAEQARRLDVDAVLVAGDAFDSNTVADRTLHQMLDALQAFDGLWVFLPGNHDAALSHSVWSRLRNLSLPPRVVIADRPVPLDLWQGRAVVLPAPLLRRREAQDVTAWFDGAPSAEGAVRIGLAHGSLAGRLPGSSEAGNLIAEHRAGHARLDYLALGDWHGALEVAPRTHYSGTPEPDRHRTREAGSVHDVELDGPGAPARIERLPVGRFNWLTHDIELLDGTCTRVLAALDALGSETSTTVLRLGLSGSLSLRERHRLTRTIEHWSSRLHHLEVEETGLRDEPSADDLDAIDTGGFVRLAVERLQAKAADPSDAERETAQMALRMIYLDHAGAGR